MSTTYCPIHNATYPKVTGCGVCQRDRAGVGYVASDVLPIPVTDSTTRKATPIWSGVLRYFPDALAAVARLSKAGNDKHNPGEPLHWSRDKSNDHGDCLVRHQLTPDMIDPETGELHATAVAWRALAQLQLLEEARVLKPPAARRHGYNPETRYETNDGRVLPRACEHRWCGPVDGPLVCYKCGAKE